LIELRRPEVLDPARHRRDAFDSGSPQLDDWLRRFAGQSRRRDTAATWVITDIDGAVMAFAAVAMSGIDRTRAPHNLSHHPPEPVPALLLARLAVDRRVTGRGVGTSLVAHVLSTAVELNVRAACKAVVVNALDERARAWWEQLGFTPFDPNEPGQLDLYLLTADIEKTLRSLQ